MKDGYLYAAGRRLITQDINAAVRGAFDGGADEVIVFDGHGGRVNVLVEDMDPRVLVIAGAAHKPRFPMLDRSVDGYTVEKTYDHLSEMYGGNWADYGIEQVVF